MPQKCRVYFSSTDEESVEQLRKLISEHAPDAVFNQGPESQKDINVTGAIVVIGNYLLDKPQAILVLIAIGQFLKDLRTPNSDTEDEKNAAVEIEVNHTINIQITGEDNVVSVISNENVNAFIEQSDTGQLTLPIKKLPE